MEINTVQRDIERSIFESIRKALVSLGYTPDAETITDPAVYNAQLTSIKGTKGFAVEPYGHSGPQSKGVKKVPRIAMQTRRVIPGELGNPPGYERIKDPLDPDNYIFKTTAAETTHIQIDIHLVTESAEQDRLLNSVIAAAIGVKRYIKFYNQPEYVFFLEQYNYYDIPDTIEGILENVYSYEVKDLYLFEGDVIKDNAAKIKEITLETSLSKSDTILAADGTIIGTFNPETSIIDLSGITYE